MRAFFDGDAYLALPLYFRAIDEVVSSTEAHVNRGLAFADKIKFLTVFGGVAHLFAPSKPETL